MSADYPTPYTPRHAGGIERTVRRDAYIPRHAPNRPTILERQRYEGLRMGGAS